MQYVKIALATLKNPKIIEELCNMLTNLANKYNDNTNKCIFYLKNQLSYWYSSDLKVYS